MSTQESFRARLIRAMHKTGCRLDDAAACADVAIREMREERNKAIATLANAKCVKCGEGAMGLRAVGKLFGLSHVRIFQIARLLSESECNLPHDQAMLPSAA